MSEESLYKKNNSKDEIASVLTNSNQEAQRKFLMDEKNLEFGQPRVVISILDSFFSDNSDKDLIKELFLSEDVSKIKILLADPYGNFAKRQNSIVTSTDKEVTPTTKIITGLQNIYCAIENLETCPSNVEHLRDISTLLKEIRENKKNKKVEIKFYKTFPWGPLYIFPHCLIFGHFGVSKDCIQSSWFKVHGYKTEQNQTVDLYDEYKKEFDVIWEHKDTMKYEPTKFGRYVKKFSPKLFLSLVTTTISGWMVS